MKRIGALVFVSMGLAAADEGLERLRVTVEGMRGSVNRNDIRRGAVSPWMTAKHQLRDWVERRLTGTESTFDPKAAEAEVNAALRSAGLVGETGPGYLSGVRISRVDRYLVMRTGVGLGCGFDESAYLYAWKSGRWRRSLEWEQNPRYLLGYEPQSIVDVQVAGEVALLLGHQSSCSLQWRPALWRIYRMSEGSGAKLLMDGSEVAYLGDPAIRGSVSPESVSVEFTGSTLAETETMRTAVKRYRIEGGAVTRVDPIALRPSDFVEEWILAPWSEAKAWTQPEAATALSAWHGELRARQVRGARVNPTKRCEENTWQVAFDFEPAVYFQVRREAPDRFRMAAAGLKPFAGCTQDDPGVEEKRRLISDVR